MKKIKYLFIVMSLILIVGCGSNNTKLEQENAELKQKFVEIEQKLAKAESNLAESEKNLKTIKNEKSELEKKYAPYVKLSEAEIKAKEIEAETKIKEAEKLKIAEAEAKAKKEAEAKAKEEQEAKKGYDTGIKYADIARNPEDYKDKKVKFSGKVVQLIEDDKVNAIRFAIDGDYDKVVYCVYLKSITNQRVLDGDKLVIYGKSTGIMSYQSTMGGKITVPSIQIEKIEFK